MKHSAAQTFIARWKNSGAAERANYQLFLSELCDLLGVPRPDPTVPDDSENAYVFERSVTFHHSDGSTSMGRIDLYKRGAFVLEAKQGVEKREQEREQALSEAMKARTKSTKKGTAQRGSGAWDEAMLKARGQAEQYARALPASEGRPPLLIVVDVGHSIELYSEFTRTGGTYVPFPDPQSHRILLEKLDDSTVCETLRIAWADPQSLDPARRTARVTRDIAQKLGSLAASLEKSGHGAEAVASFLMRALFTMFAEDMELLPKDSFLNLLQSLRGHTDQFVPMVEELWSRMKTGGFSTVLREKVRHFNGGLFEQATALPLTDDQFEFLIEASRADWRDVEPAIFGTLLERALDPIERHKLGAHYTPRAYVERLVMPTIVEPLRAEWDAAKAAAVTLDRQGKTKEAAAEVQRFHRRLCEIRVLDPACGSGNFLYVALEHLKRLEGEVLNALDRLGHEQAALEMAGFTVDPHQLLGLEVNPRAAAIAELVLWIGYLQWHYRTRGRVAPPEPIIKNFHNIECRDAVLAYDRTEPVLDDHGKPVTRWNGRTTKKHPITAEQVPDDAASVPLLNYLNPRPAKWPQTDFIVGNPPFVGTRRMRLMLGDGYVDAITNAYPEVPENADFVMYWWHLAAKAVAGANATRFGLITTNSITQVFNRATLRRHLDAKPRLSLIFAIPDHPWVEASDGAAVRVAMTVGVAGDEPGTVYHVENEIPGQEESKLTLRSVGTGSISEDLRIGASPARAVPLKANSGVSFWGVKFYGDGFILNTDEAAALAAAQRGQSLARPFVSGRDLTAAPRHLLAIDCDGLAERDLATRYPATYQHLLDHVRPVRAHNPRAFKRERWWIFGENQPGMRASLAGLARCVMTTETAKHRVFHLMPAKMLAEGTVAVIPLDDAFFFGVLSSRIHVVWALRTGGTLEDRPRYNKTLCFETFPFPLVDEAQRASAREIGESLDAHRKRQQAQYPGLTLTDIYNVLEKLRAGESLSAKEQLTHEHGLISVLRELHDNLDASVAEVYGLPHNASDEAILTHLCALNAQRSAEERSGLVRWLRPAFQHSTATATQATLATDTAESASEPYKSTATAKLAWPKTLAEQAQGVRAALSSLAAPADASMVAKTFKGAKAERIDDILQTLASLGQARALPDGRYVTL